MTAVWERWSKKLLLVQWKSFETFRQNSVKNIYLVSRDLVKTKVRLNPNFMVQKNGDAVRALLSAGCVQVWGRDVSDV